ncbi:WD40 repeat-containing protein SMU1-like protein [Chytriomyces sp. MP71]|nr:WD40 repeat-containing protein SMU1-like protein [Chytriomyces sp. MP71]
MEVECADVIRLMQQFLRENNLLRTLAVLQDESSIALNTVDSVDSFCLDITQGHWDVVLKTISNLSIPQRKLLDLYEHITIELVEMKEIQAARSLLRQTEVMQLLKETFPERYLRLEGLLAKPSFDSKEAYPNKASKEKRRAFIAQSLASEVTVVPPSRLLTLLGQSLKYQRSQGLIPDDDIPSYDLFRGLVPQAKVEEDAPATVMYQTVKFPKKAHAESVAFSGDGQYMATGAVDGLIEVWSYLTGKLRMDLKYQAEENFMTMDTAVLCLAFSKDSESLVSGSQDGKMKVWKVSSGQCIRRFPSAHNQGVTSVAFSRDGTQVLSGSFDQSVRIHGIKSGKMLKELRGHVSFVNDVTYSIDGARVISASSDGTVKIWDAKTADCLSTVTLHEGLAVTSGVHSATVNRVIPMPRNGEHFLVSNKSSYIYIVSLRGQVVKYFRIGKGLGDAPTPEIVAACVSAKGEFIYAVTEDGSMHYFHVENDSLYPQSCIKQVSEAEVINITHHPFSNIIAIAAENGLVSLYKP